MYKNLSAHSSIQFIKIRGLWSAETQQTETTTKTSRSSNSSNVSLHINHIRFFFKFNSSHFLDSRCFMHRQMKKGQIRHFSSLRFHSLKKILSLFLHILCILYMQCCLLFSCFVLFCLNVYFSLPKITNKCNIRMMIRVRWKILRFFCT